MEASSAGEEKGSNKDWERKSSVLKNDSYSITANDPNIPRPASDANRDSPKDSLRLDTGAYYKGASAVSKRKPKTYIDPKILDDSSDYSSDDQSSSADEKPLGPSLPSHPPVPDPVISIDHLPAQNVVTFGTTHDSYISCVAVDKAGNRMISASMDSTIKLWDFNSMNRSLQSFRSINLFEESPVRNVQFSCTGGMLLCSGGLNKAVVTDREGRIMSQTAKGDMYIVDAARTKGHTGAILAAKWKPKEGSSPTVIVTSSADSTVRVWDVTRTNRLPMVDNPVIHQQRVTKLRNSRGHKFSATAMDWLWDDKTCALGCSDGNIRVIDPTSFSLRPLDASEVFVKDGEEITSVTSAPHSCAAPLLLVRSSDNFLRIFDRRNMRHAVKEFADLPNTISESNACFIDDVGDFFVTGTSANRKGGTPKGSIRLYSRQSLQEVWKYEMCESAGSVVYSTWHSKLNQVLFGAGDGKLRALYHPTESRRGVLTCLSKSEYRKAHGIAAVGTGDAIVASSMFTDNGNRNMPPSKRSRREASIAMKPKAFTGGIGGKKVTRTMAKHIAAKSVSTEWSQDPREAILKYADIAKKDPHFTKAYQSTQPETLLAEKTAEQEEEDTRQALYERDRLRTAKQKEK